MGGDKEKRYKQTNNKKQTNTTDDQNTSLGFIQNPRANEQYTVKSNIQLFFSRAQNMYILFLCMLLTTPFENC